MYIADGLAFYIYIRFYSFNKNKNVKFCSGSQNLSLNMNNEYMNFEASNVIFGNQIVSNEWKENQSAILYLILYF